MRTLAVFALCTLAACEARVDRAPSNEAPAAIVSPPAVVAASPEPPASMGSLQGEYRIAGVDSVAINRPYAITAVITGDRLYFYSDCLKFSWTFYHGDGHAIYPTRLTKPQCKRGLTTVEQAVITAIDAATSAVRTSDNGIMLSGKGRTVTLFSL